jgi:NAD(P)-dependent dehydrogenase (short-subunit alcohol dehydrogenase family)
MKNSVAIVTGASQGIGRSTAIRLARDFSAVVLAARNSEALEEVADAVKAAGAESYPVHSTSARFKLRTHSSKQLSTASGASTRSLTSPEPFRRSISSR